jgi:tRNA threonylcarbamoyl adenosine modification protein (Sua5/YciO/YrdC/YwlC family)
MHPRRKTIGVRVPQHAVAHAMLAELGEPILSATLQLPGDEFPISEGEDIRSRLEHQLDLILDAGHCGLQPSTVVDLTGDTPVVLRVGSGPLETLGFEMAQ